MVSASGDHAVHPDEIIASCQALQAHLQRLQEDADQCLKEWEARLKEEELAEKRRLAPGWLDREEKILQPERIADRQPVSGSMNNRDQPTSLMDRQDSDQQEWKMEDATSNVAGDELDRAFGGMALRKD